MVKEKKDSEDVLGSELKLFLLRSCIGTGST
jgi:hypothetical protein